MIGSLSSRVLVCVVIGAMVVVAGPARAQAAATAPPEPPAFDSEVRTIRIPGTLVDIELARVPMPDAPDGHGDAADLWVATREVTWDLYDIYLYALDVPEDTPDIDGVSRPSKPYVPPDRGMGHAGFPAMGMTRAGAEAFCAWLHARTGLRARLPTPAEFEHYSAIGEDAAHGAHAWSEANSERTTRPVASLAPNRFGLFDTLGNVAEWVVTDTRRPVAMGGSYLDPAEQCTPTSAQQQARSWNRSDPQVPKSGWWLADCSWVGFRIVADEMPENEPEPGIEAKTETEAAAEERPDDDE